jgi:hypothetical protein
VYVFIAMAEDGALTAHGAIARLCTREDAARRRPRLWTRLGLANAAGRADATTVALLGSGQRVRAVTGANTQRAAIEVFSASSTPRRAWW